MPKVKCPKHGKAMRLEYPNQDGGWFYSCPSCQPMYLVHDKAPGKKQEDA